MNRAADLAIITAINDKLERMQMTTTHEHSPVERVTAPPARRESENANLYAGDIRTRYGPNTASHPPPDLPMLDVVDTTGPYTPEQLSGDEPIFAATVYGTNLVVRVAVDIVGGAVWPSIQTEGYGYLDDEAVREMHRVFGKWTAEIARAHAGRASR